MPYWLDGNNLIGQTVARAREDPATRRAFLAALGGFARSRGGRFVVYFDGDDHDRSGSPAGVQVHYCAPLSTDDSILRRLDGVKTPREVVVVTNDRSLAAGCRSAGARTMGWQEFQTLMSRPARPKRPPPSGNDPAIDLDDWVRYFGLDKRKLR